MIPLKHAQPSQLGSDLLQVSCLSSWTSIGAVIPISIDVMAIVLGSRTFVRVLWYSYILAAIHLWP
jgi:hypothetical protein